MTYYGLPGEACDSPIEHELTRHNIDLANQNAELIDALREIADLCGDDKTSCAIARAALAKVS